MSKPDKLDADDISFSISVARLPRDGMALRFEATADERLAVARRLRIPAVETFEADLVASRWQNDGVAVTGRFAADVVQTDVVTLDPIRQRVEDDVDLVFVPETSRLARPEIDGEIHLDPEGDDPPETFSGDRIDLGDALVQMLGLALDPYPRGTNVVFEEVRSGDAELSPFAVLRKFGKPESR